MAYQTCIFGKAFILPTHFEQKWQMGPATLGGRAIEDGKLYPDGLKVCVQRCSPPDWGSPETLEYLADVYGAAWCANAKFVKG